MILLRLYTPKCHASMLNSHADLMFEQDDELRAEDEAAELPRLHKQTEKNSSSRWTHYSNPKWPNIEESQFAVPKPSWAYIGNGRYLIICASLHDYRKTVVISGHGAENVHYGAHLLHSPKACDRRAHDFSIGQKRTWKMSSALFIVLRHHFHFDKVEYFDQVQRLRNLKPEINNMAKKM